MGGLDFVSLKPEALTWDTALRLFLLRCRAQNVSERTHGLYAERLGRFRAWLRENGDPAPMDLEAQHLRTFLDYYRGRGVSPLTVDCLFRILRTFFAFLHRDGLLLRDPMAQVERPRRERRFVKPITEDQLRALLAVIDTQDTLGMRDYALTLFLADTGLRLSEALAVKLSELDWHGSSLVVFGKGRKERRVAFGQTTRQALQAWLSRRGVIPGVEHLWVNRMGDPMKPNNFEQRLKRWTELAGIAADRCSPHALRHFFALTFIKNGGDAMSLQRLLGHTSLEMVRNYVNMSDDDALAKHRKASPLDRMGPLPNERRRVRLT